MKLETVKLSELIMPDYNPRTITDEAMESLKTSLKEFDYIDPIIVNRVNNHIVGGNQRYLALKSLGYTEIPVIFIDEPDINREKAINIRLNNNSGEWNKEELETILYDLKLDDFNIELTGFSDICLESFDENENYEFENKEETIKEYELPKEVFKLLITFDNETDQEIYYNKFIEEGLDCRILTL